MEQIHNQITLRGILHGVPEFSHENHGTRFYRFFLEVQRLSGTRDILPIITEQKLLNQTLQENGTALCVEGQIRTHNIRCDGKRHLLIFVFASGIQEDNAEPTNDCILTGTICREPTYRYTPLGREICDVILAVPQTYHRSSYIPCILWGKNARSASRCAVSDTITVFGRLQSREYTKLTENGPVTKTAYEVSALRTEFHPSPSI